MRQKIWRGDCGHGLFDRDPEIHKTGYTPRVGGPRPDRIHQLKITAGQRARALRNARSTRMVHSLVLKLGLRVSVMMWLAVWAVSVPEQLPQRGKKAPQSRKRCRHRRLQMCRWETRSLKKRTK